MSEYCQNLMEESLEKGNYVDHTQLESILLESQRISDKNDCAIAKFECLTPATVHGKDAVIAMDIFRYEISIELNSFSCSCSF